ncbi:MAG: hypothetical protein JXQ89_17415 [Pelagimonas sp.]
MRFLICLLILTQFATGCATLPSEARAAAILDRAKPLAKDHARKLADGTPEEARESGLTLLTVLSCWWDDCSNPDNK